MPYNNTTIFLTFCWQIIFLVIGVEVGEMWGGGGGRENSTVIIQSKWKMAAVKFRGGRGIPIIILLEQIRFTLQSPSPTQK